MSFGGAGWRVADARCRYLLRMPPEWTPEKQDTQGWDPILYIHGLGFGLVSVRSKTPTPPAHT